MKKIAWFWIVFLFSPLLLWYFTHIGGAALWCWAWLAVWFVFINWKTDELTRGLAFIVASVFIAITGRLMIGQTEHAAVLDAIQNVILLISGGVGGNFMAAYLLKNQHQPDKGNS